MTSSGFGLFLHAHPLHETPFIRRGDRVFAGQVLGLLRIGALLLPVRAPHGGVVKAFAAPDGLLVGFGDRAMILSPSAAPPVRAVTSGDAHGSRPQRRPRRGFGPWRMGDDEALLDVLSSANVACGFHAGDPLIMQRTVEAALARGVDVGAHVGFPDRQGFGRRVMQVESSSSPPL